MKPSPRSSSSLDILVQSFLSFLFPSFAVLCAIGLWSNSSSSVIPSILFYVLVIFFARILTNLTFNLDFCLVVITSQVTYLSTAKAHLLSVICINTISRVLSPSYCIRCKTCKLFTFLLEARSRMECLQSWFCSCYLVSLCLWPWWPLCPLYLLAPPAWLHINRILGYYNPPATSKLCRDHFLAHVPSTR